MGSLLLTFICLNINPEDAHNEADKRVNRIIDGSRVEFGSEEDGGC